MTTETPTDTVHVSATREPVHMLRSPRYRPTIDRAARQRALLTVDTMDCAFARRPVVTLHLVDFETQLTGEDVLTDEEFTALPNDAWVEYRVSVEIRHLTD